MSRIVSVWLPAWPIARLWRTLAAAPAEALDPGKPLVLVASGKGGARITALNRAAQDAGLHTGDLLSNARSKVLQLAARDADVAADAVELRKLAVWALRYTPIASVWDAESGADGVFLDIAGCAHLFGGEAGLLRDLGERLRRFGLRPRLAIAGTAGASWALARYSEADWTIVPSGAEPVVLRHLPVAALRLSGEAQSLLRRLGLHRIGEVMDRPRAPLAARFDSGFLQRLDQALGRAPEPLVPVIPPPVYRTQTTFLEPIVSAEHVLLAADRLLHDLSSRLAQDGVGARVLRLLLFRVDGDVASLEIALAAPSRDPRHIARLIALRLDRLSAGLDAAFGFEAAAVHVVVAEPLAPRQAGLAMGEGNAPTDDGLAQLIDRLRQRLGSGAVRQLHPRQSHLPERAERLREVGAAAQASVTPVGEAAAAARPILLLATPEPADVVALIPDGPPRQFRWRGVMHQVAEAEGPERIAPEWWRRTQDAEDAERDYYVVEDTAGRRFWLYRDGLYGRGAAAPRWFVHGVFA